MSNYLQKLRENSRRSKEKKRNQIFPLKVLEKYFWSREWMLT